MTDPAIHATTVEGPDGASDVVFCHGLFGQGRNFASIAKNLSDVFTSHLLDMPNHGRSAWTDTAAFPPAADVVADWMAEHLSGPAHLIGHSMGGKIAMALALRRPELVDRLVIVDISPSASDGASEFEHLLGSLASLDLSSIGSRGEADEALREPIPADGVRGFLLQNLRSDRQGGWRWQANLDLLHAELGTLTGFDDFEGTFENPTLWIAGTESDYVTDEDEPRMRELFPQTITVRIKRAGHWVHADQPDAFTGALRTFLTASVDRVSRVRT